MKTLQERFWAKVEKTETCWLWKGIRSGWYGQFLLNGRVRYAHRISLEWATGPCPPGMEACHLCRNRHCVAPHHLRWDTRKANVADMVKDGTYVLPPTLVGERNPSVRLTTSQVLAIREAASVGETQRSIASRYGVSQRLVGNIIHRRAWKHLPEGVRQ